MKVLDAADVADPKGRAALSRYRLERASSADFEDAYAALEREFAPRGELERREVVADWLAHDHERIVDGLAHRYHLLAARDEHGLAGVRDCHTVVDRQRRVCVVYLAHVWVAPAHRRQGLASLLRAAPITLAKQALNEGEILLAAEMEPAVSDARDTLVRLVAYGLAGFRAIEPEALPYCQPDFRHPDVIGDTPHPLPLLAVVQRLDSMAHTLPRALAEAYLRHLYAVFSTHCREEHLAPLRAHALAALAAWPNDEVPLLSLPRGPDDEAALAPLWREAVLPHHLP